MLQYKWENTPACLLFLSTQQNISLWHLWLLSMCFPTPSICEVPAARGVGGSYNFTQFWNYLTTWRQYQIPWIKVSFQTLAALAPHLQIPLAIPSGFVVTLSSDLFAVVKSLKKNSYLLDYQLIMKRNT